MTRYFNIVLLLHLFLSFNLYSQNFWKRIESPTDEFLRTLHFTDSLHGWVAGDSGLIFYTSDGGSSWNQQITNSSNKVMKLFFRDENLGYAITWQDSEPANFLGTYILKTTDGGLNWSSEQYREENIFIRSIYYLDSLRGFMGGEPSAFVITTDGGLTWNAANIDSGTFSHFPVKEFNFYNNLYGYATGGRFDIAGVIWKTTNGGDSWQPLDPQFSPPDEVWDIHFFDSLHVMGVGGDPDVYGVGTMHSFDAGLSWTYEEIGIYGQARAVSFRTENEGWCPVPLSECFVATFDNGDNWIGYPTVDSTAIYDLMFTDSLTGFAVGTDGVILKYKYEKPNSISDGEIIANEFMLYQNYPNPFNPSTNIDYYLPSEENVILKIYNILGNEVKTLINNEYKSAGKYTIKFDADYLPAGIYFYNIRAGNFSRTMKMILLK